MAGIFEKLKNTKGAGLLIIGLTVGIILLLIGDGIIPEKKEAAQEETRNEVEEAKDYISKLELRIKELLEHIDGIADVHVIVTPKSTEETVYAQNGSYEGGKLTEKEYVITDRDGDGEPIKLKIIFPELKGIAVVCRGGANPINQEKLVGLLSALLDLPSNRVYVTG
ncbi:MAG: hypothetical protein IJO00_01540 [Clostridia bacterium]|nr:hypothetical protein [Clostridia bacterium]